MIEGLRTIDPEINLDSRKTGLLYRETCLAQFKRDPEAVCLRNGIGCNKCALPKIDIEILRKYLIARTGELRTYSSTDAVSVNLKRGSDNLALEWSSRDGVRVQRNRL